MDPQDSCPMFHLQQLFMSIVCFENFKGTTFVCTKMNVNELPK